VPDVGQRDHTGLRGRSRGDRWQALKVKQSAASTATVHLDQDQNATTFHVHGGGLVISRMVNEFGIAKKVAATIEEPCLARMSCGP
jgi:hypothetical protein